MSSNNADQIFKKVDCIVSPYSASAIYNNLAIKNSRKKLSEIVIVHKDIVCIVPAKGSVSDKFKYIRCSKCTSEKNIYVTQVRVIVKVNN